MIIHFNSLLMHITSSFVPSKKANTHAITGHAFAILALLQEICMEVLALLNKCSSELAAMVKHHVAIAIT